MKPQKYTLKDVTKIDLGTKIIYKYPVLTKLFDVARMVVNGRHPKDKNTYILEHGCMFAMYVIKGSGKIYAGENIFDVPAYYPEQSEEIKGI